MAYDFLARVVEHVGEGVHVIDADGHIVYVKPVAVTILGYDAAEELVGRPVHETIHFKRPDGSPYPAAECTHLAVLGTHETIRGEDWFVRRNGSMVPVAYCAAPILLPGGHGAVVVFRDYGEQREAAQEGERQRDFLDAVLESLETGIVACGPDGVLSLFNRATREMHGLGVEPVGPEDWADRFDLFMPDGRTPMASEDVPLGRALQGERVRGLEMVIAPRGLPARTVLCNGQPIESKDGHPLGAVVAMHDVTSRKHAEEQLAYQTLHDELTGLPNRVLLLDRLHHALARTRRADATAVVMTVDLDHFKEFNARFGHPAGDELLRVVARRLSEVLRASDTIARPLSNTVARVGADEFVVLCEGITDERGSIAVADRIADALEQPFELGAESLSTTASIGIAFSDPVATPESLLRDADAARYRAQERGRARYELFDEALRARVVDRLQWERSLRRAIDGGELRLHYQPILSLADGSVVAAEALVRWEHPELGLLAPQAFIELAEESGLIVALGVWVLREGCRQIAAWERSFGPDLPLRVSVNVSARQLARPQLATEVEDALRESGADPSRLALEITETVLMEDGQTPVATLERLKRLGTQLLLDDFGTGYSSLSYLGRLPLDTLKLDRSFVAPLGPDGTGRTIAAAVIELAHALGLTVVAEGVETEDQRDVLERLGCDWAQGYLFARPMPAEEMTALLAAQPPRPARGSRD